MPDDDWALGQNEVDVRNQARREYQHGSTYAYHDYDPDWDDAQIALCTNDERCQAAADEHDPGCPIEHQLTKDFGY